VSGVARVKSMRPGYPARYLDLVRDMKHSYDHRLRPAESAKQRGINAIAVFHLSQAAEPESLRGLAA
jgi:hypothetical protein